MVKAVRIDVLQEISVTRSPFARNARGGAPTETFGMRRRTSRPLDDTFLRAGNLLASRMTL